MRDVIITLDNSRPVKDVLADLAYFNFKPGRTLTNLSILTGKVPAEDEDRLRWVPGVKDVERERQVKVAG